MDLKHFRLIKAITEEGSIANSSGKLYLTQSAISHQLRELEEDLGFKIFFRSRNNWTLTDEGRALYDLSVEVLSKVDSGLDAIKKIKKGEKGIVRIATECYSFYMGLPSFIQKMNILYPEIEADIVIDGDHRPIEHLLQKKIDLALVTKAPEHPSLGAVSLQQDEVFCWVHHDHDLADKAHIDAEDFKGLNLIIHSYPLSSVSVYENFLRPSGVEPAKIIAIPFPAIALEMVQINMGVFCVPKWTLSSLHIPESICSRKIGAKGLKRTHYLVFRKEDRNKKYIKDFVANMREEFVAQNGV